MKRAALRLGWAAALAVLMCTAASADSGARLQFDPGLRDLVMTAVADSRTDIAVEVYLLTDWGVIETLQQAAQRGVKVRVILCPSGRQNRRGAEQLSKAGVEVRWYPLTHPDQLMHMKLGVLDQKRLLLGSANWTHWGLTLHHEAMLDLQEPAMVRQALEQFEADWKKSAPHR
ncbi:MAG: phospholipase D-like domain-containing protein [candidate division FCPU426 bacterium]